MTVHIERIHLTDEELGRVTPLFVETYGSTFESNRNRLRAVFSERSDFDSVALIAVDGERVLGFQSYLRWPWSGDPTNGGFQSGNSIVAAAARGQGVFQKLLNYTDEDLERAFRFGFPVARSFPSFMSSGWTTPFSLQWWVKPLVPLPRKGPEGDFKGSRDGNLGRVIFAGDRAFESWREQVPRSSAIERIPLRNLPGHFELRRQRRRVGGPVALPELTLGAIRLETSDKGAMAVAVQEVLEHAQRTSKFHLLTFAVNELSRDWATVLSAAGFRATSRKIPFIYKGPVDVAAMPWSRWWVFRADIDTW